MRYDYLTTLTDKNSKKYLSTFSTSLPTQQFASSQVKYNNEKLEALADKHFGDGSLWWIIALFNNINNPFVITKDYILIPRDYREIINYIQIHSSK